MENFMIIKEGKLKGVFEINLEPHQDERGFFMRTYDDKIFDKYGINQKWVHENHSKSLKKGIIRGLHFQFPPFCETKLIRVVRGAIFDVFVDLRKDSSTFGKWDSIELSADNNKCLFIPKGFAHGFCTLTDFCDVLYKHDNYYNSEFESGIIWDDKEIDIKWPIQNPILSARDQSFKTFKEFVMKYSSINT
jgi:dTDP-4-dehydrorhamnose 3,5-epimerase